MKKMIALLVVLVFVLGFAGVAVADTPRLPGQDGLETSPAFEKKDHDGDGWNCFVHQNNSVYFGRAGAVNIGNTTPAEKSDQLDLVSAYDESWTRVYPDGRMDLVEDQQ